MFDDAVIMAGGSGTRLWPASSSRLPKQFLPAEKNKSFFSMALERALAVTNKNGRVIIITGKSHISHVVRDCAGFNTQEKKRFLIIGEPAAKNTAPAIACAVALSNLSISKNCDGGSVSRSMLVLTSDHIIKPLKVFKSDAALAAKASHKPDGNLVVFGIQPTHPDTGYGYIEVKNETTADNVNADGVNANSVHKVAAFHEKPDAQTAAKYTASKRFFWNSGMFAFNSLFMEQQFRKLAPNVFAPFEKLKPPKSKDYSVLKGIKILQSWQGLANAYKTTASISFDYAIAEKCGSTAMIKTNFNWIDIGNWDEYARYLGETNQNTASCVFYAAEDGKSADSCYVDSDIPVALAGVEDLIVVIRSGKNGEPAKALITKKGQTQKVREVAELIKKKGKTELL